MEEDFKILGINKTCDTDEIKKAYYTKIKSCPPERSPGQFIAVNNAYRNIMQNYDDGRIAAAVDNLKANMTGSEGIYKIFGAYIDGIDRDNFVNRNKNIVNAVIKLMKKKYSGTAVFIACAAAERFYDLNLSDLARAYEKLIGFIIHDGLK